MTYEFQNQGWMNAADMCWYLSSLSLLKKKYKRVSLEHCFNGYQCLTITQFPSTFN